MRRPFVCIAILLIVLVPQSLFAQLGGLRRRAQEMVAPKPAQQAAVQPVPVKDGMMVMVTRINDDR